MSLSTTCSIDSPVAALSAAVNGLLGVPIGGLCGVELQARLVAVAPLVSRLEGWLQLLAGQLAASGSGMVPSDSPVTVAEAAGPEAAGPTVADRPPAGFRSLPGWLGQVRREGAQAAGSQLRVAALLLEQLPLVGEAVLDGRLTSQQAKILCRLVGPIEQQALADAQPQLIEVAGPLSPAELAAWVRHLIATHSEPAVEADEARGRARRYLQWRRELDGTLRGRFVLSGEDSELFLTALEPLARRDGLADDRSIGQRRADALAGLAEQVLRHGVLPDAGGLRPQLSYLLPADWAARTAAAAGCRACGPRCPDHRLPALALVDADADAGAGAGAGAGDSADSGDPGAGGPGGFGGFGATVGAALPGGGGLPAEQRCAVGAWSGPQTRARIEQLLCDSRISRVLLDDLGQVKGLETVRGEITRAQRQALAARDGGCAARGCTRPPAMCDVHHLRRRADGGGTDLGNMVLLCRRHHLLWHNGSLSLRDVHAPWHPHSTTRAGAGPPLRR